MDDLLKQMLAVEKEAEALVSAADEDAKNLLAEARRTANAADAEEQIASAKDYDAIVEAALAKAQAERSERLRRADAEFKVKGEAFTQGIRINAGRVAAIIQGLEA